jgi:hypothetical protein
MRPAPPLHDPQSGDGKEQQEIQTMTSFRQVFLPYALMRLGDGWFLPVDAKAEKLGLKVGGHCYYLYDDGTNPQASAANWSRYEAILAKLMKLEVDHGAAGSTGRARRRYEEHPLSPE